MQKTIEERLDDLGEAQWRWAERGAALQFEKRDAIKATIIADWNAMTAVMELLLLDYDETAPEGDHPGWWGCRYCDGEQWDHPERHTPDKCPVAAAQDVLARMNGLRNEPDVV